MTNPFISLYKIGSRVLL